MTDDTRSVTVLIVEDEQSLADLYAQFLDAAYAVSTAYDGAEALDSMSDEVDVVLLDRRMPGLSGEEVLDAIREEEYDCRVAMVTAVSPETDIIGMGFDDYLTKPVEREDLIETVERLAALSSYDEFVHEYYRLASKKATLEVEATDFGLSESGEFQRLTTRLNEVEAELQEMEDTVSEVDVRSLLDRPGVRSGDG